MTLTDKEKQKLVLQGKTADITQNQQELFSIDNTSKSRDDHIQKILKEVDLQGLNDKDREQAFRLLREEADVFCTDPDNVTEWTKHLSRKHYYSMTKPLHLEVKHYIEDNLNKGWITKSASHYSSPIVAV